MHSQMNMIRCAIVRGGTSKGIFIMENELPVDPKERDRVLLSVFGSPDIRQIDGLGGADVLTSKLAIISPCRTGEADVDYTFGQVSIEKAFIDYGGNCGNISSAVGGFAIDMRLVRAVEPVTTVRIRLTNTNRILTALVPVTDGKAAVEGDYHIDGVPGTGAKITLDWSETAGGITGNVLPTGREQDIISADGRNYRVSVVDAGNIVVFVHAGELGLKGTETPEQIEKDSERMRLIERIRGEVCTKIGLVKRWEDAQKVTPFQPFFAIVSKERSHECFNGRKIEEGESHITSRIVFMGHMHKAYPVTGTVATAAAARIPGSVVYDLLSDKAHNEPVLKIAHPSGIIEAEARVSVRDGKISVEKIGIYRTARMIMDGYVYVRKERRNCCETKAKMD